MYRATAIAPLIALLPARARSDEPAPFAAFDHASEQVLSSPHNLILGPSGKLHDSDVGNNRIVRCCVVTH